ncbi:MAG: hydroxymethylglutaryl-CoA lyase [Polyangiaceae bacterium]
MFSSLPRRVSVYEVSPRDGLQNEKAVVSLEKKVDLIAALARAGVSKIEATSFVAKDWIPQLADADELVPRLAPLEKEGIPGFTALVPNLRGLERAKNAGLREVAFFMSASETHNQKNTNKSIADSLAVFAELAPVAKSAGMRVRAYLSTLWGCPYEGAVDPNRALDIAVKLRDTGAYRISLGDTIGCGTPAQTNAILKLFASQISADLLAMHMHDTRGTALANVLVGLENGITEFDAAVGGLGGCPYAPGAAGNLATEDLVYMLHGMGIETGIDLEKLISAASLAEEIVGRALPGKVHQAGLDIRKSARSSSGGQT